MNELELLKKRVNDLEQALNYFIKTDRYLFQKDIELLSGRSIRAASGLILGKSPTDKITHFGGTPVVRQSAISSPIGAGSAGVDTPARNAINSILAVLTAYNLTP